MNIFNWVLDQVWMWRSLRSAFSGWFCTTQQNPFDNSQPFFHYVIVLLLWHSISQLRTAITTMHWETNGHLGGMPLQLYHLITPGGPGARDDCMWLCGRPPRYGKEVNIWTRTLWRHTCDCVALITHAVSIGGAAVILTSFHSLIVVIC